MNLILHITRRERWEEAAREGVYRADTLDTEGFIHCSKPEQVVAVADRLFRGQRGLVLLCIDEDRVQAEIVYEGASIGERFPHIYGPLNRNAVTEVLPFEPREDGTFALPEKLADVG